MVKLPIGVQLYSVRNKTEKDFEGTIAKIKEFGYDGVEFAGLCGLEPSYIKEILDKYSLVAVSAHVPYTQMTSDIDKTVADYKAIGCKWVAIPHLDDQSRPGGENFETTMKNIAIFGKKFKDAGITLLYHNHDFEFVKMPNGEYGLDYMYSNSAPDILQTELDCCWVKVAGEDPASYVRKYAGRCPVVHLKDFKGQKSEQMYELIGVPSEKAEMSKGEFAFTPVGYGMQDIPSIITAGQESQAQWFIVEQDNTYDIDSLEAVRMSIEYLKSL